MNELVMIAVTKETRSMVKQLAAKTGKVMYAVTEECVKKEFDKGNQNVVHTNNN